MSLKKRFAQVMARVGGPELSLKKELREAIDADSASEVKEVLRLSPSLLKKQAPNEPDAGQGMETEMLTYALERRKEVAAKAMVEEIPALLTSTNASGQNLVMRVASAPASYEMLKSTIAIFIDQVPRSVDKHGNSLLHAAAGSMNDDPRAIQLIGFYYKSRYDMANDDGLTPLMKAGQSGSVANAEYFLDNGAMLNAVDKNGNNATMHAILHSNLDVATLYMKKGGVVDFGSPGIDTQITIASFEVNLDFLKTLEETRHRQKKEAEWQNKIARQSVNINPVEVVNEMRKGTGRIKAPKTASFSRT